MNEESIYNKILRAIEPNGTIIKYDELLAEIRSDEIPENAAPGEIEAVMVRLPGSLKEPSVVNRYIAGKVKKLAKLYSENPKSDKFQKALSSFEKMYSGYETVSVADQVLSWLYIPNNIFNPTKLYLKIVKKETRETMHGKYARLGRFLVENSNDCGCVKLGIALLGVFGSEKDTDLIKSIAVCEEFTYFSVKAIRTIFRDSETKFEAAIIEIASLTSGWGKIAAILELPDQIFNRQIKSWLLRYGTACIWGYNWLAVECAIKGDLLSYLKGFSGLSPSQMLMLLVPEDVEGICDIFDGLIQAREIKDADSFDEVPEIKNIIEYYNEVYECCKFGGNSRAADIYDKLKTIFG